MPFDCSAVEQKANPGTNAKNLLGFWAAENYWFTQARGESVKLTYGKSGFFKNFWALHSSLWGLDSQVLSSAGFLLKVVRRSSQTWKQRWWIQSGWLGIRFRKTSNSKALSSCGKKAPGHILGDCFYSSAERWVLFSEAPFLMGSEKASHPPAKKTHNVKFLCWKLWWCSSFSRFAVTTVT